MLDSNTTKSNILSVLYDAETLNYKGRVVQAYGTVIRVSGIHARIGQQCLIADKDRSRSVVADVVGLMNGDAILLPLGNLQGIAQDSEVSVLRNTSSVQFGESLIGRVIDGMGIPLDDYPPPTGLINLPLYQDAPSPLKRKAINKTFTTGVRAIDGLLTLGIGQRTGIFAPAGGGKSTLLSMMAKQSVADVIVIALIGERGREVGEFIEHILDDGGLERSVLVVSTSDRPAMERLKAAYTATTIAEGFRSQGKNVLFLMDSVTRFARALREIGLSIGEPPARRGFPPSVFAELPKLFERTGNDSNGSITAFYTVLTEDEDSNDPIAEEVRSLLDGHIVLTRKLAEKNHYPAIDILKSTSRLINHITTYEHRQQINHFRSLLSKYNDIEFILQVGEYEEGSDKLADEAIQKINAINDFLKQDSNSFYSINDVQDKIRMIVDGQ